MIDIKDNTIVAKPFLKWAGGKTKLIPQIEERFGSTIQKDRFTYIEPFVGSGALLFYMLDKYEDKLMNVVINDVNTNLITTYKVIKNTPDCLIRELSSMKNKYLSLATDNDKKDFYLEKRDEFNNPDELTEIEIASLMIFINKTCFNGLYRVNSKGGFNVPWGKQINPLIFDEENIFAISEKLQKVTILNGDYTETLKYTAGNNNLFYFDPPYRPLSTSSSFNAYAKGDFNDEEQIRLKQFCDTLNLRGHKFVLSNSDPKNSNNNDEFFDDLYSYYSIKRIYASRMINSKGNGRGAVSEILVSNIDLKK